MDVNSLILFAHIVEGGNLSAAARALNMTRSNVSRRLKALEEAVKTPLLVRTTHETNLTPAGSALYQRARNILREAEAAQSELLHSGDQLGGRIKVALPRALATAGLADVIANFSAEHPKIELDVNHVSEITDLYNNWTDIAIHIAPRPIETAVNLYSSPIKWTAWVSRSYHAKHPPVRTPDDLYQHPLISYAIRDGKIPLWATSSNDHRRLLLEPHVSTNDLKFVLIATYHSAGVGLMPQFMLRQHSDVASLQECLTDYHLSHTRSQVYLQVMESRYQTRAARTLADHLTQALKAMSFTSAENKLASTA